MVRLASVFLLGLLLTGCDILLGTYFPASGSYLQGEIDLSKKNLDESSAVMMATVEIPSSGEVLLLRYYEKGSTRSTIQLYETSDLRLMKELVPSDDWGSRVISSEGNKLYIGADSIDVTTGETSSSEFFPLVPGGVSGFFSYYWVEDEMSFFALASDGAYTSGVTLKQRNAWGDGSEYITEFFFPEEGFTPQRILQNRVEGPEFTVLGQSSSGSYKTFKLTIGVGTMAPLSSFSADFRTEERRFVFMTRTALIFPLDRDGFVLQAMDPSGKDSGLMTLSNSDRDNGTFHFDDAGKYWYQFDKIQKRVRQYRTWW